MSEPPHPARPEAMPLEPSADPAAYGSEPEASPETRDLAELPAPHKPFRRITFGVMALTAILSLALASGLSGELTYSLRGGGPQDLGELEQMSDRAFRPNAWVRGAGALSADSVVRYARPLERDTYRLAQVEGNPRLWVELRVPLEADGEHFVAPGSFVGRLVQSEAAGLRYSALEEAARDAGHALPKDAWLLIDGESPASTRWVIGLQLLLLGFAVFNVGGILRLARPVRDA
ncbi:MAG TPA: hypothetical protein VFQ61_38170 [Polyangiaceae bacterium]|nr:hypothetical protein [Polyangiaceae bacterium]